MQFLSCKWFILHCQLNGNSLANSPLINIRQQEHIFISESNNCIAYAGSITFHYRALSYVLPLLKIHCIFREQYIAYYNTIAIVNVRDHTTISERQSAIEAVVATHSAAPILNGQNRTFRNKQLLSPSLVMKTVCGGWSGLRSSGRQNPCQTCSPLPPLILWLPVVPSPWHIPSAQDSARIRGKSSIDSNQRASGGAYAYYLLHCCCDR
jgi:hypothetical protein